MEEVHAWITRQWDTEEILGRPRYSIREVLFEVDDEWSRMVMSQRTEVQTVQEELESKEALAIDDSKDRREIATLVGLDSIPRRGESNVKDLIGLFDSLSRANEKVDVTEWVRRSRRSS